MGLLSGDAGAFIADQSSVGLKGMVATALEYVYSSGG